MEKGTEQVVGVVEMCRGSYKGLCSVNKCCIRCSMTTSDAYRWRRARDRWWYWRTWCCRPQAGTSVRSWLRLQTSTLWSDTPSSPSLVSLLVFSCVYYLLVSWCLFADVIILCYGNFVFIIMYDLIYFVNMYIYIYFFFFFRDPRGETSDDRW